MRRSTLEVLCCPTCQGQLVVRDDSCDIATCEGELHCARCARSYAIENDIVCFIDRQELKGPNRRMVRFYDRFSRLERAIDWLSFLPIGGPRRARTEILHRLELNSERILEVSIGSGGNLPYVLESPNVGAVFGLDISMGQLAGCRRLASRRGWSVELFLGMAEALPFRTSSFDSVFHIGGINFFSDKKKAISVMIRVARPGTKIVIADESEHVAKLVARLLRLPRSIEGHEVDVSAPVDLVPNAMREIRVNGIWKAHGQYHGYCLEFRKPG